jgi:spore coat polysaccharide biosynthesis protein SpsF (cytidylyltransferase family)
VEVLDAEDLHEAAALATSDADREHVTRWLRRNRSHSILTCPDDWCQPPIFTRTKGRWDHRRFPTNPSRIKLSVDDDGDLRRIDRIMQYMKPGDLFWFSTLVALKQWSQQSAGIGDAYRHRRLFGDPE